jgi:hypothetical protein
MCSRGFTVYCSDVMAVARSYAHNHKGHRLYVNLITVIGYVVKGHNTGHVL